MGRLPLFTIVSQPFAPEPFRISAPHPEFRLFEMNRFRSGIERALYANTEKFSEIRPRTHVIHIATMADFAVVPVGLCFILMINSVESAIEIILIAAPRDPRHHMDAVTVIPPRLHARRQPG